MEKAVVFLGASSLVILAGVTDCKTPPTDPDSLAEFARKGLTRRIKVAGLDRELRAHVLFEAAGGPNEALLDASDPMCQKALASIAAIQFELIRRDVVVSLPHGS